MNKNELYEKISAILDKNEYKPFNDTIDELCKKGFPNGCFQDYAVLCDVIEILGACENYLKSLNK